MHIHGTDDDQTLPLYIANGVTGVREMFGPPDANKFRRELAAKNLVAPRVYLGSPIIDGHPKYWPTSVEVNSAEEARRAVDEYTRNGADFIKIYPQLTEGEFTAIVDETRKLGISFVGHVPNLVGPAAASAAGMKSIEHYTGIAVACSTREKELAPKTPQILSIKDDDARDVQAWQSESKEKCAQLYKEFIKNGTWPVATLTVFRSDALSNTPELQNDPRIRYFGGKLRDEWLAPKGAAHPDWTEDDFARAHELVKLLEKATGEMFRAGVPTLAGTDTGNAYCFPGFSLHDELALLVESGVTPLGALQAATSNAALFMKATDKYGIVAPGKVADMVLLDADPLIDIQNTKKIAAVFLGGREFDRAALDHILNAAEKSASGEE